MSQFRLFSFASAIAVSIALTSCGSNQTTNSSAPEANSSPATVAETTASEKNQDVDYMVSLGLMKGHLLVAKELLDEGQPELAEPHVGHPVEELYADVEGELSARNVPEFKTTLNQLHELVKSTPKDPKIVTQYEASIKAIDGAIAAIPETQRQSPQFVLEAIDGLLETAGEEYEAAIADGKFSELVEYQDSRGFVLYADTLYQSIAEPMSKENPKTKDAIAASFTELKKAWPSVNPPASPVMTPEQVSQLIGAIEKNSQP